MPELPVYLKDVKKFMGLAIVSKNKTIQDPIDRFMLTQGKQLRASLLIAVALSHGQVINDKIISGCVAVELVHLASLIHDDIIDNADTRWGIDTISNKEGLDRAVLVGDYLLAKACLVASSISSEIGEIIAESIAKLCEGQAQELEDVFNLSRSKKSYLETVDNKTASLISTACQIGAICADLSEPKVAAFTKYGHSFGMSFQIIDDILDLLSSEKLTLKPTGNDLKEGIYTLPIILARTQDKTQIDKFMKNDLISSENDLLAQYLVSAGYIKEAVITAREYGLDAVNSIKFLVNKGTPGLRQLPNLYQNWALNNLLKDQYKSQLGNLIGAA